MLFLFVQISHKRLTYDIREDTITTKCIRAMHVVHQLTFSTIPTNAPSEGINVDNLRRSKYSNSSFGFHNARNFLINSSESSVPFTPVLPTMPDGRNLEKKS